MVLSCSPFKLALSSQSAEVGTAWQGRPWPGGQWITQGFWQGFEGGPCTHHGNGVWFPSMAYLHLWGQLCFSLLFMCWITPLSFLCVCVGKVLLCSPAWPWIWDLLPQPPKCWDYMHEPSAPFCWIEQIQHFRVSEMLCKHWPTELHYQSHTEFWIFPERNPLDHSVLSLSIAGFNLLIISEDFLVYVFL
jgi:hypothetical protein